MNYQLITTGLYEKIDSNKEKLFLLSSWCNTLEMQRLLKNNSFEILPYHWSNKEKFNSDYIYLSNLYEKNLKIFSELLSYKHSIKHDEKYWRIIIGSWLRQFSDIAFDRYSQIKYASKKPNLFIKISDFDYKDLAEINYKDFYQNSKNDLWNHLLIGFIWKELKLKYQINSNNIKKINEKIYLKDKIKQFINLLNFKFIRSNKVFIHNINYNYFQFLVLNLRLNQISLKSYPIEQKFCSKKYDEFFRNEIKNKLVKSNEFELILAKLISLYLPKIYIEDFNSNKNYVNKLLPQKPKIILTTHSYAEDDLFKIWVAEKRLNRKSKYIINQHGGCIRLCKIDQEEEHLIASSDEFVSWGWEKKDGEINPNLPSIQLSNMKANSKKLGDILIVLASYPRYYYSHYSVPISEDYLYYLSNIEKIYDAIFCEVDSKIRIRFDKESRGWDTEKRLRKNIPFLKKDKNKNLKDSLNCSKIVVCTANSTVFLETLSSNFPTLLFLDLNIYQLREDILLEFMILNEMQICHFKIESLQKHLSKINNDIKGWWDQKELQETRSLFCKKYARTSDKTIYSWAKFLKSNSK